jgi:hypothetical protein
MRTPSVPSALRRVAVGVALLLAAGLAGFGGSALAGGGPTFSDVPPSHPFSDEIEWLADSGITTGYPDGTFRPGAPVTRQAMAAYLERVNAGTYTREVQRAFPEARTQWTASVNCQPDERGIAGGGYVNVEDVFMIGSAPVGGDWSVYFELEAGNAPMSGVIVTVFVTCMPDQA